MPCKRWENSTRMVQANMYLQCTSHNDYLRDNPAFYFWGRRMYLINESITMFAYIEHILIGSRSTH